MRMEQKGEECQVREHGIRVGPRSDRKEHQQYDKRDHHRSLDTNPSPRASVAHRRARLAASTLESSSSWVACKLGSRGFGGLAFVVRPEPPPHLHAALAGFGGMV